MEWFMESSWWEKFSWFYKKGSECGAVYSRIVMRLWMYGQSVECEAVYTWILDRAWEKLVAAAWKTRRLLCGLPSTSCDLPWVFLPECGSGLARVWIGSCRTVTCFVFGCNWEGLTTRHFACNEIYIYESKIIIWYQILHYCFLLCFRCVVVSHCIRWYQSTVIPEGVDRSLKLRQFAQDLV